MKRSQIKPEMELYYDRSTSWQDGGFGGGEKAVVVDDKRYRINDRGFGFRDRKQYVEDPKGNAVLVDLHQKWGRGEIRVERKAVLVAHLRGPWEQLRSEITARQEERRQATDRAETERKKLHACAALAGERAKTAGFKVYVSYGYGGKPTYIEMSVEEFERLLDAARVAAEGNQRDA